MDIIVIQYPDGTLKSSPFHLRFGTLKIIKTREKIVNISVNGQKSELFMRLSSSGDAYFLQEVKKDLEDIKNESRNLMDSPPIISCNLMGSHLRMNSAPQSQNLSLKSDKDAINNIHFNTISDRIKEVNKFNQENKNILANLNVEKIEELMEKDLHNLELRNEFVVKLSSKLGIKNQ